MNLFDLLSNAQGGQGINALAKQFGLSPQQTQSAVEALLPAFSKGFQQQASDPYGLGALLTMMGSSQAAAFQDTTKAFTPQGVDAGNSILGQLFGSKDLSRAVAAQASQATGIGADTLKQMLPVIATMLMGRMTKQTNSEVAAGTFGASNPLGEIIEQMMRQGQGGAAQRAPQQTPQSNNPLGDILGQILGGGQQQSQPRQRQAPSGSGNPLEDILGQILKGGQQTQQRAPQGGDNPLGDILGQILRGGQPQAQPDLQEEEPSQPPPQRRTQPRQPQQQSNPLEDIFGKMFNPGGPAQQDNQYQKGIDNIFEQFRKGVERYQP